MKNKKSKIIDNITFHVELLKNHGFLLLFFLTVFFLLNREIHCMKFIEHVYVFELIFILLFYISAMEVKKVFVVIVVVLFVAYLCFKLIEWVKRKNENVENNEDDEDDEEHKQNEEGMKIKMLGEDNEEGIQNDLVTSLKSMDFNDFQNTISSKKTPQKTIIETDESTVYSKNAKNFAFYDLPPSKLKVVSTPYSAIMIEPRKHNAMEFVLKNFLENLDEQWTIIVIHGNKNELYLKNIIEKKLFLHKTRIQTINIGVDNLTISQYSELFYNYKFYDYIPTETFLIFQTDSMILKENREKIYDFINYDYVGAPWTDSIYGPMGVGNGGLSLRKKSKMLELVKYRKMAASAKINDEYGEYAAEDRFFNGYHTANLVKLKKPSIQEAMKFSVESMYYYAPFGIHKCWYHLSAINLNKLVSSYPQIKILMNYNNKK